MFLVSQQTARAPMGFLKPLKIYIFQAKLLFNLSSFSLHSELRLDLTCKSVAEMIKGKTPEEIRKHFNIKNDFTKEEEEQVRRENEWCEERHA